VVILAQDFGGYRLAEVILGPQVMRDEPCIEYVSEVRNSLVNEFFYLLRRGIQARTAPQKFSAKVRRTPAASQYQTSEGPPILSFPLISVFHLILAVHHALQSIADLDLLS
jgi:hypothetical protein